MTARSHSGEAGSTELIPQPTESRASGWLVVLALVLTGLTMRAAVTSVGPVLTELRAGLHISSGLAGVITTLPVLCFAGMGATAPWLAHHFGVHRVVVVSLAAATAGLLLRALSGSFWLFVALSVLALAGGAIANVMMPSLVKDHFPNRIGLITAAYTTALAVGMTAAAGLTVPIEHAAGSWRMAVGVWAALSAVAVLPWLPTLRRDHAEAEPAQRPLPLGIFRHSRTAWALTIMFAFQSMQAYISFGWFAELFRHKGLSATAAGLLVAFFAALSIPVSTVIPSIAARGQRRLVAVMVASSLIAYLGLLFAPVGGAWLWMTLAGIGSGMFPLSLTMLGLRSRSVRTTSSLSAFVQTAGYLIAGCGPLLVGYLLDATAQDWTWPILLLLAALTFSAVGGWYAACDVKVEDELGDHVAVGA